MTREEMMRPVKNHFLNKWQSKWINSMRENDKGKKLALVRDRVGYWQWSNHKLRVVECSLAKLRIGHVGLREHLHRFKLVNSDLCNCGEVESVNHFLINCVNYVQARDLLKSKLTSINVDFNFKNILGGRDFDQKKQRRIVDFVVEFLISSGRIGDL